MSDVEGLITIGGIGILAYLGYLAYQALKGPVASASSSIASAARGLAPTGSIAAQGAFQVPGTGQTVSDLIALGYSNDEISQMLADASAQYGQPITVAPPDVTEPSYYPWAPITGWATGS